MNILYYIIIFLIVIIIFLVVYIIKEFNKEKQKLYELSIEKLEEAKKKISFLKSLEHSKKELEELIKAGAKTITLGKRILRTETASIVVVSNLIYEAEM